MNADDLLQQLQGMNATNMRALIAAHALQGMLASPKYRPARVDGVTSLDRLLALESVKLADEVLRLLDETKPT